MLPKLVRDRVVERIESGGERAVWMQVSPTDMVDALLDRLAEETRELREAVGGDSSGAMVCCAAEELGDIQQVLRELTSRLNVTPVQVEVSRLEKLRRLGGFSRGILLLRTDPAAAPSVDVPEPSAQETPCGSS